MANLTTNLNLTQIAIKRLSGKAMTNSNFTISQEPVGSTVQTAAGTIFGEAIPPSPDSGSGKLNIIQSSSIGSPGSVQLVMFEISASGTEYQNTVATDAGSVGLSGTGVADEGETTISTFHAYALRLTGSYEADNAAASSNFNSLTSTPTDLGSFPYENNAHLSGSIGRLQILPEYVGIKPGATPNPYTPVLFNKNGTEITPGSDIDWYLDPYSGMIFVQDPVDYETGDANSIPTKLQAFIYTGKYQDQMSYGISDISLHISASEGTAFKLVNNSTASFESGSAGITVTADASKKITIGASTDNVTFANLTGSNLLITNTASITYFETTYESSSIIYSSGSTKFGDTNDDTHIFTGSVAILYTGSSVGPEYGLQMSGSNFLIDYGNSGSVTLGTHNVGFEIGSSFPLTGSGLIISQSFTNEATTHNMVKIGETELVDISGSANSDSFMINVKDRSLVISSSNLSKPIAQFGGVGSVHRTILYAGTAGQKAIDIDGDILTLGDNQDQTNIQGSIIGAYSADLRLRADNSTPVAASHLIFSKGDPHGPTAPQTAVSQIASTPLNASFPYLGGAVTASHVSSSGDLFASLSLESTAGADVLAVVYDTGSGKFFYTGSYGAGGNTTQLETSASVGIHLSASQGTGFSIGLMQSASFTSGSGGGLTVTAGNTNNIEFELVGVLSSSAQIATDISGAIDAATGSLSASIVGTANEVEVTSTATTIVVGLPDDVTIAGNLNVNGDTLATDDTTFNLLDTTATTINFGGAATTVDIGAPGNSSVNIKGSASIDGDLIVKGTTTSINTEQLLVEDPFILLNSGSTGIKDGGIIVQSGSQGSGTALYFDADAKRWGLTGVNETAYNTTSVIPKQYVVSVSQSGAKPTGNPNDFGADAAARYGMMYIDTSNADADGNTIWIYSVT